MQGDSELLTTALDYIKFETSEELVTAFEPIARGDERESLPTLGYVIYTTQTATNRNERTDETYIDNCSIGGFFILQMVCSDLSWSGGRSSRNTGTGGVGSRCRLSVFHSKSGVYSPPDGNQRYRNRSNGVWIATDSETVGQVVSGEQAMVGFTPTQAPHCVWPRTQASRSQQAVGLAHQPVRQSFAATHRSLSRMTDSRGVGSHDQS